MRYDYCVESGWNCVGMAASLQDSFRKRSVYVRRDDIFKQSFENSALCCIVYD